MHICISFTVLNMVIFCFERDFLLKWGNFIMKKLIIAGVVGIGLLGNSVMASASTVDYSQKKEMTTNLDEKSPALGSTAGLWAIGAYLGGKVVDAAGNWLGKQAQKANAQSIYSAAGKGQYACYRVAKNPAAEDVSSFGR